MKNWRIRLVAVGLVAALLVASADRAASAAPTETTAGNLPENNGQRYARALLQLARLNLQNALDAGVKSPGIYSVGSIELLQQNVGIAEERLRQARQPGGGDGHSVHVRSSAAQLRVAEANLRAAVALRKRSPKYIRKSGLERLRLIVEIARMRLAKAQEWKTAGLTQAHMQWQLDQLREQIDELHLRIDQIGRPH